MERILAIMGLSIIMIFSSTGAKADADCARWGEGDSIKTVTKISLYSEFFKQKSYDDAYPYWQWVFEKAPGAYESTYINGTKLLGELIDKEKDQDRRKRLIDTLMMVYDQRIKCFGDKGSVLGRKAIDMARYNPAAIEEVLETFEDAVDETEEKTAYYVLSTYFQMGAFAYKHDVIDKEDLFVLYNQLSGIAAANSNAGKYAAQYKETNAKLGDMLAQAGVLESCESAKEIYAGRYKENPDDFDLLKGMYDIMKAAGCLDDGLFLEVTQKLVDKEPDADKAYFLGRALASKGKGEEAVKYIKTAIEMEQDQARQAEYYFHLAKVYSTALNNYSQARTNALKAASLKEGWGEPYLFIGNLYASSGKLCGSGTGWESQVVTWPAIDMYNKAKAVDPSIAKEAQEKINYYWKFMPNKEAIFFQNKKIGDTFHVGCWINESTTIRASDQ